MRDKETTQREKKMETIYKAPNILAFQYNQRGVQVKVESTQMATNWVLGQHTYSITGWDVLANQGVGGYRTFKVGLIVGGVELVG